VPATVGRVVGLWRYPVKSMQGEPVETLAIGPDGAVGDRVRAVYDRELDAFASAKTVRRYGRLHDCSAALLDGEVAVRLPDGRRLAPDDVDEALSAFIGASVSLVDRSTEHARWFTFHTGPRREADPARRTGGPFHDSAALHLLTTATLSSLGDDGPADPQRLRPNVVVATAGGGFPEAAWVGRTLAIGDVRVAIDGPCPRCVMPTLPQAGALHHDPGIRRRLLERNEDVAGVLASVVTPGAIRVGDDLVLR
jgi:uncharacterized protein YcbX